MVWPRMLAYITGTVDQELLLRNEYLAAENRILKALSLPETRFSPYRLNLMRKIDSLLGDEAGHDFLARCPA